MPVLNTLSVALLAASLTFAPTAPASPPDAQDPVRGLVRGRVLSADGRPAANTVVTVFSLPAESASHHFTEGDSGRLVPLTTVRTADDGSYAVAAPAGAVDAASDADGNLNVMVVVGSGRGASSQHVGLRGEGTGDGSSRTPGIRAEVAGKGAPQPMESVDLVLSGPDVDDVSRPNGPSLVEGGSAPAAARTPHPVPSTDGFAEGKGASAPIQGIVSCGWDLVQDLGQKSVVVGGTYVRTTGVTGDFTYTAGSTTTLGVGTSATGKYGTFSASGSVTNSSTGTVEFAASSGMQEDKTNFVYGKFGYWCDIYPDYREYKVQSRYWAGGASTSVPPAPSVNSANCTRFTPLPGRTITFTKSTSNALTFSGGASTASSIGINLSAQTGYSTQSSAKFVFSADRRLCGITGLPGGTPGRLVALGL